MSFVMLDVYYFESNLIFHEKKSIMGIIGPPLHAVRLGLKLSVHCAVLCCTTHCPWVQNAVIISYRHVNAIQDDITAKTVPIWLHHTCSQHTAKCTVHTHITYIMHVQMHNVHIMQKNNTVQCTLKLAVVLWLGALGCKKCLWKKAKLFAYCFALI